MKVNLKYTNEKSKELYKKASESENCEVPFKTHTRDFCYDCVAVSCEEIHPNVYKYGLGIALQIDEEKPKNKIYSIDGRPRSSIFKTGMSLANCEATIDEDYNGEIFAIFYHLIPTLPIYKVGDKIIQIKIGETIPIEFNIVEDLKETIRGNGGFGSTGK